MKFAFLLTLISFSAFGRPTGKFQTNFALGPAFSNQIGKSPSVGFSFSSAIEYFPNEHWGFYALSEFQSFEFEKQAVNYRLKDNLMILPLTVGAYYSLTKNKVVPYLLLGGGLSFIGIPNLEITEGNLILVEKEWLSLPNVQYGFGIKLNLKSSFMPFLENKITHHFGKNGIAENNLTLISTMIGIRTVLF
jgi:hypothetical protein